jgi:flagellar biosynthetic protein FliQ
MDHSTILEIAKSAINLLISVSLPFLLISLFVGVLISLLQALTQIQEPTLSFVPKIIAIFFTILFFINYLGKEFSQFSEHIFKTIILLQ